MGPRKIPLELAHGDSEAEDSDYGEHDDMGLEGALTAREGDRPSKACMRARELVDLRKLLERDDRFPKALEATRLAIQQVMDTGNATPVLTMLASLVWRCLCLAWQVDAESNGDVPKVALRAKVIKLQDELHKVDKNWQKCRREYFKELCALRDQVRMLDGKLVSNVHHLVYEHEPVAMFYEEVKHLPEDTKMHVAEIVEEKLKQLVVKLQGGELVTCESPEAESEEEASQMEDPDFFQARERDSRDLIQAAAAQAKKLQQKIKEMEVTHKQALEEAEERRLSAVSTHEADLEHLRQWALQDREDLLQLARQRGFQVMFSGETPGVSPGVSPRQPGVSPRQPPRPSPRPSPPRSPQSGERAGLGGAGLGGIVGKVPSGPLLTVSAHESGTPLTKGGLQVESVLRENAAVRLQLTEYLGQEGSKYHSESAQALGEAADQAKKQSAKMALLEKQLSESRAELDKLNKQGKLDGAKVSAETDKVREKLASTEAENDKLSSQIAKLKAELKLAQKEVAGSRHSLNALRTEEKGLKEKIEQLDLEKKELTSVAEGLREELDQLRAELAAASSRPGSARSRRSVKPRASTLDVPSPTAKKRASVRSSIAETRRSGLVEPPEMQQERQVRKLRTGRVFERLFTDSLARDERRVLIRDLFTIAAEDEGMKAFANSAAFSVASRLGARMRMRHTDTDNTETSEVYDVNRHATGDSEPDQHALRAGRSRSSMRPEHLVSHKDSLFGAEARQGSPRASRRMSRSIHSLLEEDADGLSALVGRQIIPTQDSPRLSSSRRASKAEEAADAAIAAQVAMAVEGEAWWQSLSSDLLPQADHAAAQRGSRVAAETPEDHAAALGKRGTVEPFQDNERLLAALERSGRVSAPRGGAKVHGSGAAGFRDVAGEQALGLEEFLNHLEKHGELSSPPPVASTVAAAAAAGRRRGVAAHVQRSPERRRTDLAQELYVQQLASLAAQRPASNSETAQEIAARWAEALKVMDPQQFPVRIESVLPPSAPVGDQEVVDGLKALVRPSSPSRTAELVARAQSTGGGVQRAASPPGGVQRAASEATLPSLAGTSGIPAPRRTAASRRQQQQLRVGESEVATHRRAEALLATRPGSAAEAKGDKMRRVSSAPAARQGSKPVRLMTGAPLAGAGPIAVPVAAKR